MALDARVITEPSGAWDAARSLRSISTTISDSSDDVASARRSIASDCFSESTNAALSKLSTHGSDLDDTSTDATSLSKALDDFGYAMYSVKNRLADVIDDATAAGLVVSGSSIQEPVKDDSDADYATKKATYDTLSSTLVLIRADESTAHDTLISACDSLKSAGEWFRDKYLPTGGPGDFSKAVGWANRVAIGTRWGTIGAIAKFQPRYPKWHPGAGRFMSAADRSKMGLLQTLWARTKPSNWVNKPYTRGTTAWKAQQAVTKAAPALKWAGRASTVLTAGLAGYEQYQKDSANPSMGEGEKIARAGTQAVTQGAGAYGGAWFGAQVGMTVGAVGGPVGVAVGGIVGGAIGGIAGSAAGKWLGDRINEGWSKLFG
ncbi:hypothetical protein [Actinomyces ruminicola]|uniref:Uncharacterized protein n=1 Tax=Actinomyces ruminicola TaxID=332524 RepID=A0A1G9YJF0_9ACTO|nr:hypothetical protein [Actinomyces ruminicola]SDN09349.1 hypothetical protein SAMN04487766_11332 [Actinomyces ruminicola]